jgi:hypothetical protein
MRIGNASCDQANRKKQACAFPTLIGYAMHDDGAGGRWQRGYQGVLELQFSGRRQHLQYHSIAGDSKPARLQIQSWLIFLQKPSSVSSPSPTPAAAGTRSQFPTCGWLLLKVRAIVSSFMS